MANTKAPEVDPSNAGAFEAWDGGDGAYWTEREAKFNRSISAYDDWLMDAAAIERTDRVLDIGCGTGHTTRDAARRADAGAAVGVDLSSQMLERAGQQAGEEGVGNVAFEHCDAQIHPFDEGSFDVAISRTGAMFFGDAVAAFTNIARALRPGGRLALLTWQPVPENHWFRDFRTALDAGRNLPGPPPDAPGPFSLSDPERVRAVLSAAGFADIALEGRAELMWFGRDADEAYRFVGGLGFVPFMLKDLDETGKERALADLRATIDAHATDEGVLYPSAAWVITARRP